MKKLVKMFVAAIAVSSMLIGCPKEDKPEPVNDERDPINSNGSYVILPEEPADEDIPADSIRNYDGSKSGRWSIYNVFDLAELANIVNGGDSLNRAVITLQNDIVVNENLLVDGFKEPYEDKPGFADEYLVVLDSIGRSKGNNSKEAKEGGLGEPKIHNPFSGVFDGNGKVISGFYAYQGHEGLGFFGYVKDATIKNVILVDSCVDNYNVWHTDLESVERKHDGYDDDRFGGLIGMVEGVVEVENCFFAGVVGSAAAKNRGGEYEYIGGLAGRVDGTLNVKNSYVYAKLYDGAIECGKISTGAAYNAVNVTAVQIEEYDDSVKTAIEAGVATVKDWIANGVPVQKFTVTFDVTTNYADNTATVASAEVTSGETVSAPAYDGAREGYTFKGWYTTATPAAEAPSYNFATPVTGTLTLYAVWEKDAVLYDVNVTTAEHGEVTATPSKAKAGDEVTLAVRIDTGYELSGTITVTGPNGEITLSGDKFIMPEGAVTVSATFVEKQKFTVTFDVTTNYADNTATVESVDVISGGTVAEPAYDGAREGFTFKGWYTTATPGEEDTAYDFTTPVTDPLTLYAVWVENPIEGGDQ